MSCMKHLRCDINDRPDSFLHETNRSWTEAETILTAQDDDSQLDHVFFCFCFFCFFFFFCLVLRASLRPGIYASPVQPPAKTNRPGDATNMQILFRAAGEKLLTEGGPDLQHVFVLKVCSLISHDGSDTRSTRRF